MASEKQCGLFKSPLSFYGPTHDRESFVTLCNTIEADINFYENEISDEELLRLFIDDQDGSWNVKKNIALSTVQVDPHLKFGILENYGKLYKVKTVALGVKRNTDEPGELVWQIDTRVIHVRVNGPTTFHEWVDVQQGELKKPLTNLSLNHYLTDTKMNQAKSSSP